MPIVEVRGIGFFDAKEGENLLALIRRHGVTLPAGCGGLGLCGMCRVRVVRGELTAPTRREIEILADRLEEGWRLACQAQVIGNTTLEIQAIRRETPKARVRPPVRITPPAIFVPVRVERGEPSYEEELISSLRTLGVHATKLSLSALNSLAQRSSGVAVIVEDEVLDVSDTYSGYGLAVDVGTTSVAASLVDLVSGAVTAERVSLNAQLKYGSDIISRIRYALQEPDGTARLQQAVVDTVNRLLDEMGARADKVYRVVVAGNSVMLHLFFGANPRTLGFLPFRPLYRRQMRARGRDLGLTVHPDAHVVSLPILGGYVGGDVVGDILSADLSGYDKAMLIDVGTNGEIVLKKDDAYLAASTPAGPAFEGVGLHSGMMAVEGAIEKVRVLGAREIEYSTIGGTEAKGICGSGYVDLLAELLKAGILSRDGRLLDGPRVREVGGVKAFVVDEERGIMLTQLDVRKLQLAVTAVKFTAKYLLKVGGVNVESLEAIVVAGDFGYHLDPQNAMEIGLLPRVDESAIRYIGNGSLTGAEMYMLSDEARKTAEELLAKCRVLDVPREERDFISELKLSW
ncbi:MAG: ASKHA domain-containing protein [Thermofilaceae archaeon]